MLHNIYFSAKGRTEECANWIAESIQSEISNTNLLRDLSCSPIEFSQDDVLLLSMPVYGGFIPRICLNPLTRLRGNNTPAIIAAVYGNRNYDDALIQMKRILTNQGFHCFAAGAFIAEHSIFPDIASGRPDSADKAAMRQFADRCKTLLKEWDKWDGKELTVPGNASYDSTAFHGVPFQPNGDETCSSCCACVSVCPMSAISAANPRLTDKALCISCGACIHVCPAGSRNYQGQAYEAASKTFEAECSARKEPETFFIL